MSGHRRWLALLLAAAVSLMTAAGAVAATVNPILVVTSGTTNQGAFIPEMLRAEGLGTFDVADISAVNPALLAGHDTVVLARMALPAARVTDLTNWVNAGGNLVAFEPDAQLAPLLGLQPTGQQLSEAWLLPDPTSRVGSGIVRTTLQYHGTADLYTLAGATALATLYADPSTATAWPAVTVRVAGAGRAAAFTYDLATSLVWMRQGNPAWAAQERDGITPTTSDDKYYGALGSDPHPDWVDRRRMGIPQADEQQRLFANLVTTLNPAARPLPRLWFLPQGRMAVVVMTGDDHGNGGTPGRFDAYAAKSPADCLVDQWQCIRSTSYVFTELPLSDVSAAAYNAQGFEISLHLNSNCADVDRNGLSSLYDAQLATFASRFPSLPPPITERHHCVVWSDWDSAPIVQLAHGIRLDTSYYAWPAAWIDDLPGYMTGSAQPMPLMTLAGTSTGVFQVMTHMTDESGQTYPGTIDTLLDNAVGPNAFYGVLTVNAHTDFPYSDVSDAVIASAQARGVAVISARQLLTWLDGRNASSIGSVAWNGSQLTFTVQPGSGATGLQAMIPLAWNGRQLATLTAHGTARAWTVRTVKGIDYAMFAADTGNDFAATYTPDTTPPDVAGQAPANGASGVDPSAVVTVGFTEAMDPASVNVNTVQLRDAQGQLVAARVSYDPGTRVATLQPLSSLATLATYTVSVAGGNANPAARDVAGNAVHAASWQFTTSMGSAANCPCTLWPDSAVPGQTSANDSQSVEVGVQFKSDLTGYITGIRFYKGPTNGGTHVANLWTADGTHLATATYTGETATGWQTATFAQPVPIASNTVYVASTLDPMGGYAQDQTYFQAQGVDSPPLHALHDGLGQRNGVFKYGPGGVFPNDSYMSSNYWVDVVFTTSVGVDHSPPTVTSPSPAAGEAGDNVGVAVKASFSKAIDPTTVTNATFELRDAANNLVPSSVGYAPESRIATLWPASPLAASTTYTARLHGGGTDPRIHDTDGNALAADVAWSFTTGALGAACAAPANPVVAQNCLAGSPSTEWDVGGVGDTSIEGFATQISAKPGDTVNFKINTSASAYRLDIYRLGYYGGAGARQVAQVLPSAALPQVQPPCKHDDPTGLDDCGTWGVSASWTVPAGAVSGIYVAKLVRSDTGGASHIVFVVRDDTRHAAVLFQTSDTTWQAYNDFQGQSLYTGGPGTNPGRAYKVSYNRPFHTRGVEEGSNWLFNAEYPMVRWLEQNGYDVSYLTGVDADRDGSLLLQHRAWLSVGHDEYWSGQQRANVTAARDAGVNLAFLSGNEGFWKTRWEASIDGSNTPYRTLVCYKETHANAKIDPSSQWTGTWRDPRFSPPADGGRPENALNGTLFMVNNGATTAIQVPQADGRMRLWRNTDIANLGQGQVATLPDGTLGYEWDVLADNGVQPPGLVPMSTTTVTNAPVLQDYGSNYASGTATHRLGLYKAASGARVFGAGTIQWSWGLDTHHDRTPTPADTRMQQATMNLLADDGVQPATPMAGLVVTSASTDATPPTSTITSPANGANITPGTVVTITGTATDAGGGQVGGVEVSTDGGATWHPASGRGSFTTTWTAAGSGNVTLRTRAVDDSANLEVPGPGITVHLVADTQPPTVTSTVPAGGATQVSRKTVVQAVFSEPMSAASITSTSFFLKNANGKKLAGTVTYDAPSATATLTLNAALGANSTFTATVLGGSAGVKDLAGNAMKKNKTWSFTTK